MSSAFLMSVLLCVTALVLTALASATAECPHARCYPSSSDSAPPFATEAEAIASGRCLAACIQEYAGVATAYANNPLWPSVDTTFLESLNGGGCEAFQKIMECRLGCVTKSTGPELSRNSCRSTCLSDCQSECGDGGDCDMNYRGSFCSRKCFKTACGTGCGIAVDITGESEHLKFPPSPESPPILSQTSSTGGSYQAGLYNLTASAASSRVTSTTVNITVFIFKVEAPGSTPTGYYVQKSLQDLLDLSHFACNDTNISLAAVNAYGASDYSPPSELCIHKEGFPSQPTDLLYEWSDDEREGFEGRAILNITWNRPEGYEYLSHYELALFTENADCGIAGAVHRFRFISPEKTSFILWAEDPTSPPAFNCGYQITVQAFPVRDPDTDYKKGYVYIDHAVSSPIPTMNLTCRKLVNETTGNITILTTWEVPHSVIDAIENYQVWVTLVEMGADIPRSKKLLSDSTVRAENQTTGGYLLYNVEPQTTPTCKLRVRVTPREKNNQWSRVPDMHDCFVDAQPESPTPVNEDSVLINDIKLENMALFLIMSWDPPEIMYGMITKYEVRVTILPGSEHDSAADFTTVYKQEFIDSASVIQTNQLYINEEEVHCLYAQIRSRNKYLWGVWSRPVTLTLYPTLYPNCSVPYPINDLPSEGTAIFEHKQNLPLFVYVVIGAGVCGAVAFVVLLMGIISLCKKHKRRKQMQRVFKDQSGYSNPMYRGNSFRNSFRGSRHTSISHKSSFLDFTDYPKADEWEIPSSSVVVEEQLGEGCFGEVHKGIVKGPIPNSRSMKNSICVTVALKFLKSGSSGSEKKDFLNEIGTMKTVAEGNNPHVVNLIGCVTIREPLCLITEFVKHGDLLTYLQTIRKMVTQKSRRQKLARIAGLQEPEPYLEPQPSVSQEVPSDEPDQTLTPDPGSPYASLGEVEPVNLISFAYQIASGMEYLASLDIVHRDLACRNILVAENKNLRISDFGMSRQVIGDDVYVKTSKGRLPWKWMAIESIVNREFTTASDVWAYGITLWEIATLGGFPYPMIPNGELLEHLKRGYRLEGPENCSREIYEIMLDCWQENPASRPTFTQLKAKFDTMLLANNQYIQFDGINIHEPYYKSSDTDTASGTSERSSEDESTIIPVDINTSEFESSSASSSSDTDSGCKGSTPSLASLTLQSESGSSGYDVLRPKVAEVCIIQESSYDPISNAYVDTPTKLPNDCAFDLDVVHIQQTIHEDTEPASPEHNTLELNETTLYTL